MYGDMSESKAPWLVPTLVTLATVMSLASIALVVGKLMRDRDALQATITALREGDGSCAVMRDGVKVVCWMEAGSVRVMPLKPGDVIVSRACLERRRIRSCAR